MIYRDFLGDKVSLLGFGTMRMPILSNSPFTLDDEKILKMVQLAHENGVNYFDTALPYQNGMSEVAIGKALHTLPRDSFFLADKFPGHQIASLYDPKKTFEAQLARCQVDYFDFYLLHNVYENSIKTYEDPRWNIIEYFVEQKKNGRIRHLGFSSHGQVPFLKMFLDKYGDIIDFCQIQLNYVDWTLQDGEEKVKLLNERNIPIIVMEPVRGGKLCSLSDEAMHKIHAATGTSLSKKDTAASYGYRFFHDIPGVKVVLSGMSTIEQMAENTDIFSIERPLSAQEKTTIFEIAEDLKQGVPCTGCSYCTKGCPMGLDIPNLMKLYNDYRFLKTFNLTILIDSLPENKRPSACISCRACTQICPQKIDIPTELKNFTEMMSKEKSWAQISKERESVTKEIVKY